MEGKIEDLAIRPAKVPKILQIGIFGMMNFRKKRRKLKSQLKTIKKKHILGNQTKYHLF